MKATYSAGEVITVLLAIADELAPSIDPLIDKVRNDLTLTEYESGRLDALLTARRTISHHVCQVTHGTQRPLSPQRSSELGSR